MVVRVAHSGQPAFQLRKGEEGVSVFDMEVVIPPLTESEILEHFRHGSVIVARSQREIEEKGLRLIYLEGADPLPPRLREAHAEVRPGPGMTRVAFKQALKELE